MFEVLLLVYLKFRASSIMKLPSCAWWLTLGDPQMDDCLKCQTATATPAEPGGLFGFARCPRAKCGGKHVNVRPNWKAGQAEEVDIRLNPPSTRPARR